MTKVDKVSAANKEASELQSELNTGIKKLMDNRDQLDELDSKAEKLKGIAFFIDRFGILILRKGGRIIKDHILEQIQNICDGGGCAHTDRGHNCGHSLPDLIYGRICMHSDELFMEYIQNTIIQTVI